MMVRIARRIASRAYLEARRHAIARSGPTPRHSRLSHFSLPPIPPTQSAVSETALAHLSHFSTSETGEKGEKGEKSHCTIAHFSAERLPEVVYVWRSMRRAASNAASAARTGSRPVRSRYSLSHSCSPLRTCQAVALPTGNRDSEYLRSLGRAVRAPAACRVRASSSRSASRPAQRHPRSPASARRRGFV